MTEPLVTVLIPAYNRADYLGATVESVQRQTETNWRCIVIDDHSEDNTREVGLRYVAGDDRISILTLPENRGLGQALNAGLEEVRTPYFVILDSDDWFSDHTISACLTEMSRHTDDVSLVCGNAAIWEEMEDGSLVRRGTQFGQAFADQYEFFMYGPNLVPRFLRTSTVRDVGGFEVDPLTQGRMFEDKLLLLKLIHISRFAYVNDELYHIRIHKTNMTKPETRDKFIEIKRYIYTRMLKEWGDEYEVEFFIHPEGWLDVKALKPKAKRPD
ncbi:glycosyltransferase family 2 protein [Alicyclobacillus dauci]|uniref:Glycosyltransferase family 2 protein n=1 Tax=Alicyclobacillus dauci TaxID=1475485 RepID=A0ABY6Z3W9_9BACL|nr:glycosyltransferase family 2 protein [Alicyclobacillus dauci]WAH36896.1 glycosyltransferase family 2 protein [Alicyclobacillus dauci]